MRIGVDDRFEIVVGIGDRGEGGFAAADLGHDFSGGVVADERFGVMVPVGDPEVDGVDEVGGNGCEASPAESLGGGPGGSVDPEGLIAD